MEKNMEGGEVMGEYPLTTSDKNDILKAIDKSKLSILRGMHSGDKVANILTALVEKIIEDEDLYIWKCPECGFEAAWDADTTAEGGSPVCGDCDVDMKADHFALFDTKEWKEADAYVLRIKVVRGSKGKT